MRLSRPCYDKPHRCPGWAGGGWRSAAQYTCVNGSIRTRVRDDLIGDFGYPGDQRWRFGHCNHCNVVTWPVALCHTLDPSWWKFALERFSRRVADSWDDYHFHGESMGLIYATRWRRY